MPVNYTVPAVARAIQALDLLAVSEEGTSLANMAKAMKIPKSTLFRILVTLTAEGLAQHDQTRKTYRLGMRLAQWGHAVLERIDVRQIARPHLVDLARTTLGSYYLALLEGDDVILVDRADTPDIWRMVTRLGSRPPAHATASGQVLLSGLDESGVKRIVDHHGLPRFTSKTIVSLPRLLQRLAQAREDGFVVADGEHRPDMCSLSVPVYDHTGRIAAALSTALHSDRADKKNHIRKTIPTLKHQATLISHELGYTAR